MAAIDLQRGLEHGARGWGQDRAELLDSFDSEMQEWEDQLQDMQRKIEELYNEVQARRGGSDVTADSGKNVRGTEFGPGHSGNGFFNVPDHLSNGNKDHPVAVSMPKYYGNGYTYVAKSYSCPASRQNGYGYYQTSGVSEIGDLLEDYLGQGKEMKKKNNVSRHVHFNENIKVSQDVSAFENGVNKQPENDRTRPEQCAGSFEEVENRKNRVPQLKSSPYRESSPNKENTSAKPPYKQRDSPSVPPRSMSQAPNVSHESPALDRKSFTPVVLVDRKCNSPSVLRKFGAMLQENEGKMLTDTGVMTHQGLAPEPKCPTPGCQRRALWGGSAAGRAPARVPTQKCQAESDVLTGETEGGQEWGLSLDSGRHNHTDQRGYSYPKGPQPSPQQAHRKVEGSTRPRPRANSVADKGLGHGDRSRKPAPQPDYTALGGSSGSQRTQRAGLPGQAGLPGLTGRDDGLIELLDMLDIQHEYSSGPRAGHTPYRLDTQQVNLSESPLASPQNSFSRPARPANQRPPSRWACRTAANSINAPSGPMYRPPSPLARPPSPMRRSPNPALKHKSPISYSLHTETVIM